MQPGGKVGEATCPYGTVDTYHRLILVGTEHHICEACFSVVVDASLSESVTHNDKTWAWY